MVNTKFELYKVQREIKRSGVELKFKRPKVDGRKQIVPDEYEDVKTLKGLYHEQNSNIQIVPSGETTMFRTKKIPMILCSFEDSLPLQIGDCVEINGKLFAVTGTVNIQEWSIIGDISLEVFDNGKH